MSVVPQPSLFVNPFASVVTTVTVSASRTTSDMDLNGTLLKFSSLNSTHQVLAHDSSPV
ncbi:MAG: hypothetical protein M0C28_35125 [Candidatus Moduliflexus flocculans]|nr:hypothetical protein [Candidatus Moduliflexus flocculans]